MTRGTGKLLPMFLILIFMVSSVSGIPFDPQSDGDDPLLGTTSLDLGSEGPSYSRDGSRAVILSKMIGSAPNINGQYTAAAEWSEAQQVSVGITGNTIELYMMADGEVLYVLVDMIDDTDLDNEPTAPACLEYSVMIFDGDNDGVITYDQGEQGSAGVSDGGKNADFGILFWGDGALWVSDVVMDGNNILFDTSASTNVVISTSFSTTPNSGVAHRVMEYSVPYDGPNDHLGSSLGYPFTKGFNIQVFENNSNTQVTLGQNPDPLNSISNTFDSVTLPQKYPHIIDVVSPLEGAVFQQGQDIKFEIDATDNNDSTLQRKLILNSNTVSMGAVNTLIKNDLPVGQYDVSYRIDDNEGFNDTTHVGIITVAETATPPVIGSTTPSGDTITINEGEEAKITVNWHDLNLDQANESVTVTWKVDGQPADLAWINKTSSNVTHHISELTFKSDYLGDFDAGIYVINFELVDKYFDTYTSVMDDWTITVKNVNQKPKIEFTEPPAGKEVTVTEEESASFTVHKSDADLDVLTVKWYLDDVLQTSYNDNDTYIFNDDPPGYDLAGSYVIKVVVGDDEFTAEAQWDVTVTNINRPPIIDESQLNPDSADVLVDEGDNIAFSYKADDEDGDILSYTWFINDVTADQGTGTGTFTFETTYLMADGYDSSDSPYYVKLVVTDGDLSDEFEWKIEVDNVNRPPVPNIERPKEGDVFKVDEAINFKSTASYDPDGEKLSYTWDFGDRKTATGSEVNHEFKESGRYSIELKISDGQVTRTATVNITIAIATLRVDILEFDPISAKEGEIINISVKITNIGNTEATNVKVKFFVGTESQAGFIGEYIIPVIPEDDSMIAVKTWVAKPGNQLLIAVLEPSDDYEIQGLDDKQKVIQIKAKPAPPSGSLLDGLMIPLILIIVIVVILVMVGAAMSGKKKRREQEEDEAVQAIIDSKHAPPPKHKAPAPSPFDQTDFQFGAVEGERKSCSECGTMMTNLSGMCDNCTFEKKEREEAARMMECPVCGNEVSKDMFTCPYCHFNFSKMDKEEEVEEEEREAVGYVSDDACADCGVLFNDGMSVIKCPSCEATYHKRCSSRLGSCYECNADLSAGMKTTFKAPSPPEEEITEPLEEETEPEEEIDEAKCPSCGDEIEEDWKVCPNCDTKLGKVVPVPVPSVKEEVEPVPKVEPEKVPPPPPEDKCPSCSEEIESDWKVCPNCDFKLGAILPVKKIVKPEPEPKVVPKKTPPPPPKVEECVSCGEEIESDWKVCPNCDHKVGMPVIKEKALEPKKKVAKKKRKITWSRKAKEKAGKTEPVRPVRKVPPKKTDMTGDLKVKLEDLKKDIAAAEKEGKVIKKAKSLATLAGSFLKGKKPDKAKIYIERSRKELEK